ncbi:kinase-like domain-containing protein, partial [Tribonema minus]
MDAARLEVGAVIGVGSYAEVRRGAYRGTPVAVKTLKAADARALQRFRAEILLMKDLRHPNIVMLLGASWSTGRLMMVVELFERGNLADVLDAAQLTWRQKFSMLEDIARGMAYLHSARYYDEATQTYQTCIIHRDLKPQNMLVTATLGIKITDFGEARVVDNDYTMTQVGTLLYIAPEIVRGDKYDEKCDVYSFAVVLLGMLQLREHVFDLFVAALRELREEDVSNSGGGSGGGGSAVRRLSRSGRGSDKGQA